MNRFLGISIRFICKVEREVIGEKFIFRFLKVSIVLDDFLGFILYLVV